MPGGNDRPRDVVGISGPLVAFEVFNQSLAIARGGGRFSSYTPLK